MTWIRAVGKALVVLLIVPFLIPARAPAQSIRDALPSAVTTAGFKAPPRQPIKFERISLEAGLSQSSVYCIVQDSQGFLWFGTEDGLNKYDGTAFTIYRNVPDDPNSLSHNMIWAMHQDREGDLWIGTGGGGLNRLNRETGQFVHYRAGPGSGSLSSDYIRAIHQDQDGMLWIGTAGGGLNRFDPFTGRFEQYRYVPGRPDSLGSETVRVIYEDRQGQLWIGTEGGGLSLLVLSESGGSERATGYFVNYQHDPGDPQSLSGDTVMAIYEDREGGFWIGTDGEGLNRLVQSEGEGSGPGGGRFERYKNDPGDPNSLSDDSVSAIFQDSEGVLWVGTQGGGLNRLVQSEGEGSDPGKPVAAGQRYFAHYRQDLYDDLSLSNDLVWSIFEDRMGVLWIGTGGGGINKFNRLAKPFVHYQAGPRDMHSLSNGFVWSIYEDGEGVLWIGTRGGLDRLGPAEGEGSPHPAGPVAHYQHNPDDPDSLNNDVVRVIHEDRSGLFWLGLDDGKIDQFDRATGRIVHYQLDASDPVLAIHQDREGNLWAGTSGGGLYWYDPETDRFVYYRERFCTGNCLSSEFVRDIHEDQQGVLWLATLGGGLNRFEPARKRFTYYLPDPADPDSLSHNTVLSLHEDSAGVLWVGTHGGGLNRFDREAGTFTHYREQDGLANDVVYGILQDRDGHLWLSTNRGLSRFDPKAETFRNYDVSDGLQSNEFNGGAYFQSQSGEMFFGGINGFNAFFPEQVKENIQAPPVVLTSVKKFNQTVLADPLAGEQIRLSYQDNFLSFEFAALDYSVPEQNQYAYKMEGLDRDWIYAGTRRHAEYPNLRPGKYLFRVKGSNSDGVWNEEGTWLLITITPPFWATWWFRGAILLLLAGGAVIAHRLRVRSIEARSRELATLVEQRTADLRRESEERIRAEEALRHSEMERAANEAVAAERSRLARDLHDAVSQTLFSAGLIADALPKSWERDRVEGRQLLKELRQLTQGALAEMRTLLLELRPAALVEADLGDLLRQLAEAAQVREGLPVTVVVDGQGRLSPDVHIALYRIAQEALNNVVKHARASQVAVALRFMPLNNDDSVRVELGVSDDGRGFDPAAIPPECLGLGIMRERAKSIGAHLTIESGDGRGTKVMVAWPDEEKWMRHD